MTALVGLMDGMESVRRSTAAQSRESAAGAVTATVALGATPFEYDGVEVHNAHAENFDIHFEAVDDTVEAAHARMIGALNEVAALWWTEEGRTLSGCARMATWGMAGDFGLLEGGHEGRQTIIVDVAVRAIVDNTAMIGG